MAKCAPKPLVLYYLDHLPTLLDGEELAIGSHSSNRIDFDKRRLKFIRFFYMEEEMRDWKKFENDEIMTIWKGYLSCDFNYCDPLRQRTYIKPIRLTPREIVNLVDELMDRLEMKNDL